MLWRAECRRCGGQRERNRKPLSMMHRTIEAPHHRRWRDLPSVTAGPQGICVPLLFFSPLPIAPKWEFALPAQFKRISGDHEAFPPARQLHFRNRPCKFLSRKQEPRVASLSRQSQFLALINSCGFFFFLNWCFLWNRAQKEKRQERLGGGGEK